MHVIKLNGYNATTENGEKLELGTFDSYGEEQLQIVKAPDWVNLSVIATFNPPNKKPVQVVVDSVTGVIKVPKEATADLYAAGTPVQVAYKLAEPVPFTATGAQPIPALAGVNTVLTDADAVEVTGRADPIKRITDLEAAVASIN